MYQSFITQPTEEVRKQLWQRLSEIGVSGKLFKTIKALYPSVTSCIRVNNMHTDWFDVKCGLRQGCILSPILLNLYINDLDLYLKSFGKSVKCNDDYICTLLYADGVVLLAETEQDLQVLLEVYTKLYKSVVCLVIEYSANIWGFKSYSCIKAVQNRAMRVFLGVGKYTSTAALLGELGWEPCISRQWLCIGRHIVRMSCTNSSRLNKRIALWGSAYASPRCRNWFFVFAKRCKQLNLNFDVNISCPISKILVNCLHSAILQEYNVNWFTCINSKSGP